MFNTIIKLLNTYGGLFLSGAGITLFIAAVTVVCGTVLGGVICFARLSQWKPLLWLSQFGPFKGLQKVGSITDFRPLNAIAAVYVEIIRGTPMLLQIVMVVFVIPDMLGWDLSKLTCVIIALCMNSGAYVSELIRAGIQAVDKGQSEAARSLGMTNSMTMREIVLPQAIKNILPALCNEFIMIIKDSSLGSTYFVGELMTVNNIVKGALYLTIEPLIIVALIYFTMTFTLSKAVGLLERRMAKGD